MKIKRGDKVVMTQEYKNLASKSGSDEHVEEFGNCIGIVGDLAEYNGELGIQLGPEVEVFWQPLNLVYHYHPKFLKLLKE